MVSHGLYRSDICKEIRAGVHDGGNLTMLDNPKTGHFASKFECEALQAEAYSEDGQKMLFEFPEVTYDPDVRWVSRRTGTRSHDNSVKFGEVGDELMDAQCIILNDVNSRLWNGLAAQSR